MGSSPLTVSNSTFTQQLICTFTVLMKVINQYQHGLVHYYKFGSTLWGKPSMYIYVYFVDGLLIDTGHSNMRKEITKTLSPLPVQQMYLTHHHEDHTGNILPLVNQFDCPIYASTACAEIMKQPPPISFAQWQSWGKSDRCDTIIPKDDYIETDNFHFEIIPIPGHARDMVCLYEKNEGWLFSADLWVYHYIKYFMRPESMSQQISSLQRIIKLDFEILFCSHNPQLTGGKAGLINKLSFLQDFYEQVATLHHQGLTEHQIFTKMNLTEKRMVKFLSGGSLSTINMVRAVIQDENNVEC